MVNCGVYHAVPAGEAALGLCLEFGWNGLLAVLRGVGWMWWVLEDKSLFILWKMGRHGLSRRMLCSLGLGAGYQLWLKLSVLRVGVRTLGLRSGTNPNPSPNLNPDRNICQLCMPYGPAS